MPLAVFTLPCQIDGLSRIYTYERHAFFKFENQEKLQKAKDAFMSYVKKNHYRLYLNESILPEHTEFVFGVSADVFVEPVQELIHQVAKIMTTEASLKKDIPITPIIMEQLIYKG